MVLMSAVVFDLQFTIIMATSSVAIDSKLKLDIPSFKLPLLPLLFAMLITMLLSIAAIGAGLLYLVKSGHLPVQASYKEAKPTLLSSLPASHLIVLQPILANLADPGGMAYLKISLTLRVADALTTAHAPEKDAKADGGVGAVEAEARDAMLMIIGRQTAESLLGVDGKKLLKLALRSELAEKTPELKVIDLYFVDFLVQR
jgi:flagellar FliL protein